MAVVDPGVGGTRRAVWLCADGRTPDNGLFEIVARRARALECHEITWQPASASFHGRDLFAPIAARLVRGETPAGRATALTPPPASWPDDLAAVLYIDHYGNLISGLRASEVSRERVLRVGGRDVCYARTFEAADVGGSFGTRTATACLRSR